MGILAHPAPGTAEAATAHDGTGSLLAHTNWTRQMKTFSTHVAIGSLEFEPVDNTDGYLLGAVQIGEVWLHVDAIRVETINGLQTATRQDEQGQERLDLLYQYDPEGPFATTTIPGHTGEWVIVATPFKS